MTTIRNRTVRPIKVPLGGGKFLRLGPGMQGQIGDRALKAEAVRRLIEAGEIEVAFGPDNPLSGSGKAGGAHAATHGHPPKTTVKHRGNR
jgi:hypothetical protein